ncbi:hypothetical protein P9112_012911 [Eukaryota sp. TZLM1-RC]
MLKGSARRFSSHFIKKYRAGYALCPQLSTISVKDINTVRVHEGYDALPVPATESLESPVHLLKQPRIIDAIKDCETKDFKQNADELLTKWICASGVSFNSVMLPEFKQYQKQEQELSGFLSSLTNAGCTLVFDGWKDVNGSSLLKILLVSNTFSFFVKSINISDEKKSGYTLYLKLKEVVDYVGSNLITHIVSDSATNCLSACSLLIADYPHIIFSPCASHTLDLLIEDMCKLPSFNKIISDCKMAVDFIRNHTIIKTKLEKVAGKTLMRPAATRFYTQFLMLSRLQDLEPSV